MCRHENNKCWRVVWRLRSMNAVALASPTLHEVYSAQCDVSPVANECEELASEAYTALLLTSLLSLAPVVLSYRGITMELYELVTSSIGSASSTGWTEFAATSSPLTATATAAASTTAAVGATATAAWSACDVIVALVAGATATTVVATTAAISTAVAVTTAFVEVVATGVAVATVGVLTAPLLGIQLFSELLAAAVDAMFKAICLIVAGIPVVCAAVVYTVALLAKLDIMEGRTRRARGGPWPLSAGGVPTAGSPQAQQAEVAVATNVPVGFTMFGHEAFDGRVPMGIPCSM